MYDSRIRSKSSHYQNDEARTLEFFKLVAFDDSQEDLNGKIWVYTATLLSNVKFELNDPMNSGQLLSYVETDKQLKIAGSSEINTSKAIVIAEFLSGGWFIIKELVVPDE